MGLVTTIRCDGHGCTTEKRAANHWWVVATERSNEGTLILMVTPFTDQDVNNPYEEALYLCGEECVLKMVSKFMNRQGDPLKMTEMG